MINIITRKLILGNRNFVPEVTSVQKLYDWDGLSMRIKNLCRTTKFVHLIGCQGGNNFLGILKKSSWQPIKWTNFVVRHKFLMGFERPSKSYNFCTKVTSGTKFRFPSVRLLLIQIRNTHHSNAFLPLITMAVSKL